MATTRLTKTLGTPTNNKKWTWSAWIKRGRGFNVVQRLFYAINSSNYTTLQFDDESNLIWFNEISGVGTDMQLKTNQIFKDAGAWYHIVIAYDSANSTAANRQIIYINGVRVTSFATENTAGTNANTAINQAVPHTVGSSNGGGNYFDGLMSHVHFVDGTAYAASTFGSTDSTTGIWKINTSPSITMGNNGFTILKDGNTITDQSSNSNNFSLGSGTLTKTQDCPSNNFTTVNPSAPATGNLNYLKYGNLELKQQNNPYAWSTTLCGYKGKWYWEQKVSALGTTAVGILKQDKFPQNGSLFYPFVQATGFAYKNTGNKGNNNNDSSYGNSYTSGDILSVAFDQTNGTIWFGKNGTWQNNATDAQIAAGTTTYAAFSSMPTNGEFYGPFIYADGSTEVASNFGNGYFGTTAVSSAGTNASGNGIFEYNVPAGFTGLSTKGLNL